MFAKSPCFNKHKFLYYSLSVCRALEYASISAGYSDKVMTRLLILTLASTLLHQNRELIPSMSMPRLFNAKGAMEGTIARKRLVMEKINKMHQQQQRHIDEQSGWHKFLGEARNAAIVDGEIDLLVEQYGQALSQYPSFPDEPISKWTLAEIDTFIEGRNNHQDELQKRIEFIEPFYGAAVRGINEVVMSL